MILGMRILPVLSFCNGGRMIIGFLCQINNHYSSFLTGGIQCELSIRCNQDRIISYLCQPLSKSSFLFSANGVNNKKYSFCFMLKIHQYLFLPVRKIILKASELFQRQMHRFGQLSCQAQVSLVLYLTNGKAFPLQATMGLSKSFCKALSSIDYATDYLMGDTNTKPDYVLKQMNEIP